MALLSTEGERHPGNTVRALAKQIVHRIRFFITRVVYGDNRERKDNPIGLLCRPQSHSEETDRRTQLSETSAQPVSCVAVHEAFEMLLEAQEVHVPGGPALPLLLQLIFLRRLENGADATRGRAHAIHERLVLLALLFFGPTFARLVVVLADSAAQPA